MMDIAYYVVGSLFVIIGIACMVLVVFQMPGTWIMLIIATLAHLVDVFWIMPGMGSSASPAWGWWAIAIGCALALVGEGIEFVAGALGAKAGGGSKRAAWGAISVVSSERSSAACCFPSSALLLAPSWAASWGHLPGRQQGGIHAVPLSQSSLQSERR